MPICFQVLMITKSASINILVYAFGLKVYAFLSFVWGNILASDIHMHFFWAYISRSGIIKL